MCGIAGYALLGAVPKPTRYKLVTELGARIDVRGGHSSGWHDMQHGDIGKVTGTWEKSPIKFRAGAASGDSCILHARWATCGDARNPSQAHPFLADGKAGTIVGVHNGVFGGTHLSAGLNGRSHTVDSREFYHLLADGDLKGISHLTGYGALAYRYLSGGIPGVHLVRLTPGSDMVCYSLEEGGYVYGSTAPIVLGAIKAVGLHASGEYEVRADGRPTVLRADGVYHMAKAEPIKLASSGYAPYRNAYTWKYDDEETAYRDWAARYCGE